MEGNGRNVNKPQDFDPDLGGGHRVTAATVALSAPATAQTESDSMSVAMAWAQKTDKKGKEKKGKEETTAKGSQRVVVSAPPRPRFEYWAPARLSSPLGS